MRREFVLRSPTNWAEVGKVDAAISQELKAMRVQPTDDKVSREVSNG